jgi:DNA transposition AAA+ family ATPase
MSDLRERWTAFLRSRPDLSAGDLAAHTTLGPSTVRNFLAGSQPETERIASELTLLFQRIEAGEVLTPGASSSQPLTITEEHPERVRRVARRREFYEIETVRRVAQVLDYCHEQAAIGVITGDFGVGKTEAVSSWRQGAGRRVESLIIEFNEFTRGHKIAFLQELAEALGLPSVCGSQTAGRVFRLVCEHLALHPCLLIFDQCDTVRTPVFQVIRQIWDHTRHAGVGIVLLSAPVLLNRLRSSGLQDLGALTSRIGVWAPLAGVSRAEMAAIVKQEGITDVDEDAFDLWYRATEGSMRRLMAAIDLVKTKHQGKRITPKTIAGVAGHLWGMPVRAA